MAFPPSDSISGTATSHAKSAAPKKPIGVKEVPAFAWKLVGLSCGVRVTLFKAVERPDVEAQLGRLHKDGYYKDLEILDIDAKVTQPKSAAPKKTAKAKAKASPAKKKTSETTSKAAKAKNKPAPARKVKTAAKSRAKAAAKPSAKAATKSPAKSATKTKKKTKAKTAARKSRKK